MKCENGLRWNEDKLMNSQNKQVAFVWSIYGNWYWAFNGILYSRWEKCKPYKTRVGAQKGVMNRIKKIREFIA